MRMASGKILIVDDDKEFLEELREVLVNTGYEVVAVADGIAASKAARVTRPDVILLDLRMKGMSGFEVADRLKRSWRSPSMVAIGASRRGGRRCEMMPRFWR